MANGELLPKNVGPSPNGGSGGSETTPASPSPLARAQHGAFWPLLLRSAGLLGLLVALAAIGTASLAWTGGSMAVAHTVSSSATDGASSSWQAADRNEPRNASADAGTASADGGQGLTADGKVILNLASADELRRLPGVGKRRAERILALRERLKRFRRVTDLLRIRGLGVKAVRRIEPHVVLDPPRESDAGAP